MRPRGDDHHIAAGSFLVVPVVTKIAAGPSRDYSYTED
jgi:hypothetical protein